MRGIFVAIACLYLFSVATADAGQHRRKHYHHPFVLAGLTITGEQKERPADCRGIAWCGCFMRHLLGVASKTYNLARAWAHYGHATSPHDGAIVVWSHHVGKLIHHVAGNVWVVLSGNDGHAVRSRARSISGAIAFRE